MALNPETFYSKTRDLIGYNNEIFKSGVSAYPTYTAGTFRQQFNTGDMLYLNLWELNPTDHSDADHGLPFDIFRYPNNVTIRLRFWCSYDSGPGEFVLRCAVAHYHDGIYDNLPEVSLGPNYHVSAAVANGVKIALMTVYPEMSAVEDLTKADRVAFYMFAPYTYYDEGNRTTQTWGNIAALRDYQRTYEGSVPKYYEEDGTSLMMNHAGTYPVEFYAWDNIETLETRLNNLVPLNDPIISDPVDPNEPVQDDNTSEPGGGNGTGGKQIPGGGNTIDPKSDPVDHPSLPTHGAVECGAITTFAVSTQILQQIFQKLWSTSIFDISTWQKLLEAPLDSLIGLQVVPVRPVADNTDTIWLGNFNTTVDAYKVTQQYYTLDCGQIRLDEYFGSALDYTNTRVEIFLPFIGIRELQTDDVMSQTIGVKYNYDIITGDLVANIKCGPAVLYKFAGNVKETIPVSSVTNTALENILRTVPAAAGGVAAGAPMAMVNAAIGTAMSRRIVSRAGDLSGSVGILDEFTPYIILHRPMQSLARTMRNDKGYISNISASLGNLTGYTEVEYIHLTGIDGATDTELEEIESKLKEGVIL